MVICFQKIQIFCKLLLVPKAKVFWFAIFYAMLVPLVPKAKVFWFVIFYAMLVPLVPKAKVFWFAIFFAMLVPRALGWKVTYEFMFLIQNLASVFKS